MGTEFRGALAAGVVPTPDYDPGTTTTTTTTTPPPVTTVAPDDLRVCVPWWDDVDVRDPRAVGRWGEALVYQYLLQRYPGWRVTWLNEKEESSGFYDIKLESPPSPPHSCRRVVFIEVKTTRWADRNAFELSPWEWDFAQRPGVGSAYHVYRVYSAGDPTKVRITVVKDPAKLVREHAISLCLAI